MTLGWGGQSHPGDPHLSSHKTHCFKELHCPLAPHCAQPRSRAAGRQGECSWACTPYFPLQGPEGMTAALCSRMQLLLGRSPLSPTPACVLVLEPTSSLVPSALERKVPSSSQLRVPYHLLGASLHPIFFFVKSSFASFFKLPNQSVPSASCQDTSSLPRACALWELCQETHLGPSNNRIHLFTHGVDKK